jgi:hypothetical protein
MLVGYQAEYTFTVLMLGNIEKAENCFSSDKHTHIHSKPPILVMLTHSSRKSLVPLSLFSLFPALLLAFPHHLSAQTAPILEWFRIYDGPAHGVDIETAASLDPAGNFYITGRSSGNTSGQDYAILKYSPEGDELLLIRIDGSANNWDEPTGIIATDAGFVITGNSALGSSESTILTMKYDSSGTLEWRRRYPLDSSYYSTAAAIGMDAIGSVIIGGTPALTVVKYSKDGTQEWEKTFRSDVADVQFLSDIAVSPDGNIYATGAISEECPEGICRYDMVTMKYDSDGNLKWVEFFTVSGNSDEQPVGIALDKSQNVFVVAAAYDSTGENSLIVKYSRDGYLEWIRSFDGTSSYDNPIGIEIDNKGDVVVAGTTWTTEPFNYSILKYDTEGELLWSTEYSRAPDTRDFGRGLDVDSSGSIYVSGSSRVGFLGVDTSVTIKLSPTGSLIWSASFLRPDGGLATGTDVLVDHTGNVYVLGGGAGAANGWDFLALKYQQVQVGITGNQEVIPELYSLSQNYPNPFNPITTFSFTIYQSSIVNLSVYDLLGREVATLVDEKLGPGTYTRRWDATGMPSGSYFYRLRAGKFVQTKKLILTR